jgi:hypothetical protein
MVGFGSRMVFGNGVRVLLQITYMWWRVEPVNTVRGGDV